MKFLWLLLLSIPSNAAFEKGSVFVDFSKIQLDAYLQPSHPEMTVESMDTKGDGKNDTHFVFLKSDGDSKVLLKHLFDLNGDQKIDLAKHFEKGKVYKVEADLDFDNKADVVSEYDPKTGELLKKTQSDGKTNIWRYWHEGKLRLKEMDRNSDGKPDIWVHYRSGKVVKTEVDVGFDGKTIKVQKTE